MSSIRDVYVTAALLGLALLLFGSATYSVAVLMADPARLVIELVIWVPALAIAAALLYWRRWGLLLGIPVGGIGVLVLFGELDPELTTPRSFFDFVPTLLALSGVLVFFLACLVGSLQHFRGVVTTDATRVAYVFKVWVGIVALSAVTSAALTVTNADGVSAQDFDGALVVTADQVKWNVQTIDGRAGQALKILVKNDDPFLHTFTVHDLGIDEIIGPWSEKLISIEATEARIYGFICRIEDHKQDMSGAIVIR